MQVLLIKKKMLKKIMISSKKIDNFLKEKKKEITISKGISFIAVAAAASTSFICKSCITHPIEFEVAGKEVKTEASGKSARGVYYVFTKTNDDNENTEVFQNTDNWLKGKFSSSDLYQKLEVGKRYKGTATGWRIPFISWYRNIIDADLVFEIEKNSAEKSVNIQMLEGRFASSLFKMIQENPNMDISDGIKAFSEFEAVRDKENASKIKILGNKYQEKYLKSNDNEEFKLFLQKAAENKAIAVLINKQEIRNSGLEKTMYYRLNTTKGMA